MLMNYLMMLTVGVFAFVEILLGLAHTKPTIIQTWTMPRVSTGASITQSPDQQQAREIVIKTGNFFFEGPEGKSGSESKTPTDITPKVVAKLKNGERVKLVFVNVGGIDHEIISPLFSAPEEKRFALAPGEKFEDRKSTRLNSS